MCNQLIPSGLVSIVRIKTDNLLSTCLKQTYYVSVSGRDVPLNTQKEINMNINDIVMNSLPSESTPTTECQQPQTPLPKEMPIGMLYVPFQEWRKVYDPMVGFERGTIFEELDKPFIGERTL